MVLHMPENNTQLIKNNFRIKAIPCNMRKGIGMTENKIIKHINDSANYYVIFTNQT